MSAVVVVGEFAGGLHVPTRLAVLDDIHATTAFAQTEMRATGRRSLLRKFRMSSSIMAMC